MSPANQFSLLAGFLHGTVHMDRRVSFSIALAAASTLAYRERKSRKALERMAAGALETLLNAIDANDEETGMHVRRVAAYALVIAEAADLDERRRRAIERVALFHDIGKIHEALFDLVHDERRLTPGERRAIATHPGRGAEVLAPLAAFYPELPAGVLAHHERWDGTGYPRKLRGARIPLEARVVTIADTFDAVTHGRRYRPASGVRAGLDAIADGRGKQFDPNLVDLALLPPVVQRLARVHRSHLQRDAAGAGRERVNANQENDGSHRRTEVSARVPDVSFRWRSESLGSRRVRASRDLD